MAGGGPIPAAAFAARARSSHAVRRCGGLFSNVRPHPTLGGLCQCSEQRLQVLPAVAPRSDFSRLCLSTPPSGACETRVAPTRAAQRAGWGLVFFSQLALELKIIHPPLVSDLLLFPFIYEAINEGGWRRSATRDSMKRVDCDLEGLPFMILITAPVGVEAASHIFASLAIGAAPPVTRKRRRGR